MSDTTNDEAAGVGAADPVTGITGAKDDLAADARLQGSSPDDGSAGDHEAVEAESLQTVTNDAVAGETVEPGLGDGNDGPTGGAPGEITPIEPANELAGSDIDLDDER